VSVNISDFESFILVRLDYKIEIIINKLIKSKYNITFIVIDKILIMLIEIYLYYKL